MKRTLALTVSLALAGECLALVNWKNSKGDWDMSNVANWSGTDNQWKFNVNGHYLLKNDWTLIGMIFDEAVKDGRTYYFDFDPVRTLTITGGTRQAIASNGASRQTLNITGGTVLVTEDHWSNNANNQAIIAPQRAAHSGASIGSGVVVAAYNRSEDSNVRILTPMIRVGYDNDSWFVASNKAQVTVGVCEVGAYGPGNGNGVIVDSGATMTFTNQTTLKIGAAGSSVSNKFIVSDGGVISGCNRLEISGGTGNMLAFRGEGTDVTFADATAKSLIEGVGMRLEVTDGAKFTMDGAQGRIWIGTASSHSSNVLRIAGAGSRFTAKGTNFLVGQNASAGNGVVVTDGAKAEFSSIHVGHGGQAAAPARGNYLRVEKGGEVIDTSDTYVGGAYGAGAGNEWSLSNRLEVVDGGSLSVAGLYIGYITNSVDNSVLVRNGTVTVSGDVFCNHKGVGSRLTVTEKAMMSVGGRFSAGPENQQTADAGERARVEVSAGGLLSVAQNFTVHGANCELVVSNGTLDVGGSIQLPFYYDTDRGMRVTAAGANPVVRAANGKGDRFGIGFRYDAQVHFVVPDGGYAEAPFQSLKGEVNMANNWQVPMTFDLSACGRGLCFETVLVESKDKQLTFGENQAVDRANYLRKVNDAMPRDAVGGQPLAKVCTTADGCRLVLRVGQRGAAVIVK